MTPGLTWGTGLSPFLSLPGGMVRMPCACAALSDPSNKIIALKPELGIVDETGKAGDRELECFEQGSCDF